MPSKGPKKLIDVNNDDIPDINNPYIMTSTPTGDTLIIVTCRALVNPKP